MAAPKCIVVGAGSISRVWLSPLKHEKVRIAAMVDLDRDRAGSRIEEFELGDTAACDDLDAALAEHRPDFVLDLTVPEAHCEVTCKALAAGAHVIGEKPMAASMTEARKMVRAAEAAGRMYMVSQSRRWNPLHEQVRRTIGRGSIGELTGVHCDFHIGAHFGGFRAEMPSPLILDMAIHHFDLARMMSGLDPIAVYAREYNPAGSWFAGDAAAECIFEMTGGAVFSYSGSWCSEGCSTSTNGDWRFQGRRGALRYAHDEPPTGERVLRKRPQGLMATCEPVKPAPVSMKHQLFHGGLREMLRFLRTGKLPQSECHDNIKSMAMVFAVIESSRKGRRVEIRD